MFRKLLIYLGKLVYENLPFLFSTSSPTNTIFQITTLYEKNLKKRLTYRHILQTLGNRAFGISTLFFSLPSLLPFSTIPGVAVVFSLPIAIFAFGMILGRKSLWFPKAIGNKTIEAFLFINNSVLKLNNIKKRCSHVLSLVVLGNL